MTDSRRADDLRSLPDALTPDSDQDGVSDGQEDRMIADGPHVYTWRLNGNGGGNTTDGTFQMLPSGARWNRPAASVLVSVMPCQGEPVPGHRLEEHATGWGQWAIHEMLTLDADMDDMAGFLAVVYPVRAGEPEPVIEEVPGLDDGVAAFLVTLGDVAELVVSNRTGGETAVSLDTGPVMAPPGLSIELVLP